MKITDILSKACACVPLTATDKSAAITELVDLLHADGHLSDRDAALQAVLAREQTRSTGIGMGLAVPHGKSRACNALSMAVGKPAEPMEFGAIDHQPCTFIVLLTSPIDETGPPLPALASRRPLRQTDAFPQAPRAPTSPAPPTSPLQPPAA